MYVRVSYSILYSFQYVQVFCISAFDEKYIQILFETDHV